MRDDKEREPGSSSNTTSLIKPPVLRWPTDDDDKSRKDHEEPREDAKEEDKTGEAANWVEGADDREKDTYKEFLRYCEARRNAWHAQEKEDQERRMEAGRREEHWRLLRESVRFLKENEKGWQQRKIKEVDRIKEEEKDERLEDRDLPGQGQLLESAQRGEEIL